jgi:DNA-binding NtrC family response regulator
VTGRPRILVLDDDADARCSFSTLAEREFDVAATASLSEAGRWLAHQPVDVVVADLDASGGSGLLFLDRVATLAPDAVSVLVSGRGDPEPLQAARARRPDLVVLEKPYAPERLLPELRVAARRASLRAATRRLSRRIGRR